MRPIEDIDRIIGARVRERRIMEGKSQQDLADALNVTFQMVGRYENADKRIPLTDALLICKTLGWTMDAMLLDLADMDPQDSRPPLSPAVVRIAMDLDELSAGDKNTTLIGTVTAFIRGAKAERARA